jgi:hypothetical protein
MKNAVFWDVKPRGSFKNRRFGGLIASIIRVTRIDGIATTLAVTSNVVPSLPVLVTLMEAIRSSETSIPTRPILRNIPEDDILHSHRRENLEPYIALTGWTL